MNNDLINTRIKVAKNRLKADVLTRIRALRLVLDSAEDAVRNDNGILNGLGEIQGEADKLDCRIAALAELRNLEQDT